MSGSIGGVISAWRDNKVGALQEVLVADMTDPLHNAAPNVKKASQANDPSREPDRAVWCGMNGTPPAYGSQASW
jgi:hypothetical protein